MTQEILLIRHGEPVPDKKTPLALRNLRAWLAGGGKSVPSVAQVRRRAQCAAQILSGYAQEHGAVLVMAHRIINHALRSALEQSGWRMTEKTHNSYWGMMRFTRDAPHR